MAKVMSIQLDFLAEQDGQQDEPSKCDQANDDGHG